MTDIPISKGSKFLLAIVVASMALAILYSIVTYLFNKDYLLYIKIPCNPANENCFVQSCESEDPRCPPESEGKFYYKVFFKKEGDIPRNCSDNSCLDLTCRSDEESCAVFLCSDENLETLGLSDTCSDASNE